jgi:hypothetical protein
LIRKKALVYRLRKKSDYDSIAISKFFWETTGSRATVSLRL